MIILAITLGVVIGIVAALGTIKYVQRRETVQAAFAKVEAMQQKRAAKAATVRNLHAIRLASGMYSINDVAELVGLTRQAVNWHVLHNNVAAPTHKVPKYAGLYYNAAEKDLLVKYFADNHDSYQRQAAAAKKNKEQK